MHTGALPRRLLRPRRTRWPPARPLLGLPLLALVLGMGQCIPERGRVAIVEGNVVADNGMPLRGEHFTLAENFDDPFDGSLDRLYDHDFWRMLVDDFHLNTVRLLISRPPQNWTGGTGHECFTPAYRCYNLHYVMGNGKTVLEVMDDAVDKARRMGMYIIIDYHAVGGWDAADAFSWWTVVAPRYADHTHVIYDIINEPVMWNAEQFEDDDVAFIGALYNYVRSLAPDTHLMLWGFGGATPAMRSVVEQAPAIDYANASVSYHPYGFDQAAVLELREAYPIIAGEVGGHSPSQYLGRITAQEAIGASWVWLDGAQGMGTSPNGLLPEDVTWPRDPGTR